MTTFSLTGMKKEKIAFIVLMHLREIFLDLTKNNSFQTAKMEDFSVINVENDREVSLSWDLSETAW